ncbi:helix-turn-helix domain-containing protein [Chryseobacterium gwangjuense]|uniref:helix-turn-helix domain-containing protein n=1 Tax=Chryseobacterium gwangjuense TaxID=1069980 RepID=UPI001E374FF6|nr:helix-turn-helix domain-containing protein [Chryseobacterium gwangjuense]MCE3074676.1 helix-turn-helix domain-containing protein [Chryseobacterium gwangjuense]
MKKKASTPMYDEELLADMLAIFEQLLETLQKNQYNDSLYYDSADVKRLLNISDSTLFRIRKSRNIPYVKIGRKIFYPKSFFKNLLKK